MPYGTGYYDKSIGTFLPDDPIFTCDICNHESTDEEDFEEMRDGKFVCSSCKDDQYHSCDVCGLDSHEDEMHEHGNKFVCDSCFEDLGDE